MAEMKREMESAQGGTEAWQGPRPLARPGVQDEGPHLSPEEARALDLEPGEVAEEEELEEEVPQQVAIGKRFGDWRTIASFAFAVLILGFAASKVNWPATWTVLKHANIGLFVLAFVAYYISFPIRTHRWRRLMHNSNHGALRDKIDHYPTWDLTQILYLSWFANVIIPAKLGDVYRAYLARRWIGVSLSRTVGNVLAERILDLIVLFPLLMVAAFLTFQAKLFSSGDDAIKYALLGALALSIIAAAVLTIMWRAGESVLRVLPHRFHDVYQHFRHGAVSSFGKDLPSLFGQTVVIWLLEGARLTCILAALGLLTAGKVGPAAAIFLALGSSVITTLPLTPGGLGVVEAFIPTVLVVLGIKFSTGVAVALLDRIISYLSIAVFGFILYVFSDKARGAPPVDPTEAAAAR